MADVLNTKKRSLFAFAGSLLEPDVVKQLVHMGIEALLSLTGAPDLNDRLDVFPAGQLL